MPLSLQTPNSSAAQEAGSSEGAEDPLQKVYAEFCLTGTTQGDTLSGPVVESALQPEDLQLFRDYARDYHRLNTDSAFCPEEFCGYLVPFLTLPLAPLVCFNPSFLVPVCPFCFWSPLLVQVQPSCSKNGRQCAPVRGEVHSCEIWVTTL